MNTFKQRKIRNKPPRKPLSEKAKHNITTALGIILLIFVVYYGGMQLLDKISGTRLVQLISGIFGKELMIDEHGRTNILLLGVGGEGHEGRDLTDTLIVANINHKDGTASMISIPRDLHVDSSLGGNRINKLYEQGKMKWSSSIGADFVRETVANILDVPIQYYMKVDFEAFEEIVDSLDGIDVYVDETIDDPLYPSDEYDYEPFYLAAGSQHLDGEIALKYVRSRKSSSDFDRSKRQQKTLIAIKNKAQEKNLFSRNQLLKKLYYSLNDHVETNMSMREMLSLAEFGIGWNADNLMTATLNDEDAYRGGFLYVPLRELYGGAYVLLPAGDNFDSIRHFVQIVFYGPKNIENIPVAILNGTGEAGLAGKASKILNRFGIKINSIDNARSADLQTTSWYIVSPEAEPLLPLLQALIPGNGSTSVPVEYTNNPDFAETKLVLEIGMDSLEKIDALDIFKNIFELKPTEELPATNSGTDEPASAGTDIGTDVGADIGANE